MNPQVVEDTTKEVFPSVNPKYCYDGISRCLAEVLSQVVMRRTKEYHQMP